MLMPRPRVTTPRRFVMSLGPCLVNAARGLEALLLQMLPIGGQSVFAPFFVHWFHSP